MINNGPPLAKPTPNEEDMPIHEQLKEKAIPNKESQVNFFSNTTFLLSNILSIVWFCCFIFHTTSK